MKKIRVKIPETLDKDNILHFANTFKCELVDTPVKVQLPNILYIDCFCAPRFLVEIKEFVSQVTFKILKKNVHNFLTKCAVNAKISDYEYTANLINKI